VCVVDVDLGYRRAARLHAWPIRAYWEQPANIQAAQATMQFLRATDEVSLIEGGHVWLCDSPERSEEHATWLERQAGHGVQGELLSPAELTKRYPLLDRAAQLGAGALWLPSDAATDPLALRDWFRKGAQARGVCFEDAVFIEGLETSSRQPGARRIESVDLALLSDGTRSADAATIVEALTMHSVRRPRNKAQHNLRPGVVINALGAWSSLLRTRLGQRSLGLPRPRQLSVLSLPGHEGRGAAGDWPALVVDSSGAFFFADSAYTIAGIERASVSGAFDLTYAGEAYFQDAVWPLLAARAEAFERVHHLRGTVVMEACTPDGSGVLGRMPGYSNAFEAFGFGGAGLSHVYALARGLAEWIIEGRYTSLDLESFGAQRFDRGEALYEPITL